MTPSESAGTASLAVPNMTKNPWRVIISASIGNALEWFDLIVYGFFAATISKQFFPGNNDTVSLLIAFGTFGISFFMRPLGAIVLGIYSDRAGRKASLTLSIVLMTLGTFIIAVLPGYATIGIAAPILLTIARVIQGFSAGGEFGSSTAFMAEHALERRGFFASFQVASQGLTTLLASVFGALLTTHLSAEQMSSWGWRVPFVFGLIIGPVAYYIRRSTSETPAFIAEGPAKAPLRDAVTHERSRVVYGVGAVVLATVATYIGLYMPTHAIRQLGMPPGIAFSASIATGFVQMIGAPIAGHLSDKFGRMRPMLVASVLLLILLYPLFRLLQAYPNLETLLAIQIVLGLVLSAYFGPLPALLAELFPTRSRTIGMALAYNISVTIFGGFAPFIITWLIATTGDKLAPSFYGVAAAFISTVALIGIKRHRWLNENLISR